VVLVLGGVRVVEVLDFASAGRIASAAAVAAALEALEAATAAREATATAADDAPEDAKYDETTNDNDANNRPPRRC
jgi:ribosomal protein L12E/L44/L45/RPP1/RPP2